MNFNGVFKQHGVSLFMAILAGSVAVGVALAQMEATNERVDENTTSIKEMNKTINEVSAQQKVLIERVGNETKNAENFRIDTTKALDRILDKLEDIGDD